jgi:death-on-curing protein
VNDESPLFLSWTQIQRLHEKSLAEFGGSAGLRDEGLLESAFVAAQNTWLYGGGTCFDIAASYAFHIAQAQAFVDGNKRTGAGAALLFLDLNGWSGIVDDGSLYDAMIAIAEKRMDKRGLSDVLQKLCDRVGSQ